jgi:hypothetical protein
LHHLFKGLQHDLGASISTIFKRQSQYNQEQEGISVQSLVTLFLKQYVREFNGTITTHQIELQTTIFFNVRSSVN